jgi:hypothetical protein
MKTYGTVEVKIHVSKFGTMWRTAVYFTPWLLCFWGKIPNSYRIGAFMGPRAGLHMKVKRKIFAPAGN